MIEFTMCLGGVCLDTEYRDADVKRQVSLRH